MSLQGLQNSFGRLKNIQHETAPGMTRLQRDNRGRHKSHPNKYHEELASDVHEHTEGCANRSFGRVDDTRKKNGI
jgi:hypothetical protein